MPLLPVWPSADDLIAATESVVIIAAPEADGQEPTDTAAALAATAAELAATAVDELPVDNDIIAATESDVIRRAIDTSDDQLAAVPLAAAVAAVNNAESGDVIINVYGDIPADDEDSDAEDDITSAKDEAGPSDAVVSESLAVASATAAATDTAKHDSTVTVVSLLSSAEPSSPASSSSSLTSPPPSSDTKFVSAGASAVSVDLHSPIRDINKAVVELDAQGVEPVEPVHVNEGLAIPATDTAASSSGSSTESGAQAVEQQEQATGITQVHRCCGVLDKMPGGHVVLVVCTGCMCCLTPTHYTHSNWTDGRHATLHCWCLPVQSKHQMVMTGTLLLLLAIKLAAVLSVLHMTPAPAAA